MMKSLLVIRSQRSSRAKMALTVLGAAVCLFSLTNCTTVLEDDGGRVDRVDSVRTVTETSSGPLGGTYVEERQTTTVRD